MQHRRHSTTAGPTDKRQRECYIIWQVSLVRLNGPYCLRLFGYERGKDGFSPTASASFQVGPRRDRGHVGSCLTCVLLLAGSVHALDPNKHVTQYIHTAWRTQDGSLPAGMFSITQTSDGFLWFLSLPGDVYRFDGVRFLPRHTPADFSSSTIGSILADHAGGLWVVADELIHLKGGVVTSHFAVNGASFQIISQDPDGSVWVATRRGSDQPLCHVTERSVRCFGKNDGIPISQVQSLLADGHGGFWLGGETALVHWHGGVSEHVSGQSGNNGPGGCS